MIRKNWLELRSSLWFVPSLLVLMGLVLSIGLVEVDLHLGKHLKLHEHGIFDAGADGARGMLVAIASSMITVAGVAFSITIVTLSQASTQYTPRILRNFMRDRANQTVLGAFVGIFTYCLVVLRTIRGSDEGGEVFVPLLAVFGAMLLSLISIGFLIFFIHHISASIQASYILDAVTKETLSALSVLFPEDLGEEDESGSAEEEIQEIEWHVIGAPKIGYIQGIDTKVLIKFASESGLVLKLNRRVGDFVLTKAPLISASAPLDREAEHRLQTMFVLGDFRTVEQDAGFGIRQIVDIAMKALSPGVNDTSTAVSCLDYLSAILSELAPRRLESPFRAADGKLCVIATAPAFHDYVAKCFDEIRLSAPGNVTIYLQMLCAMHRVAYVTRSPGRKKVLITHTQLIIAAADDSVKTPYDRQRINIELDAVREVLGDGEQAIPSLSYHPAAK